MSTINYDFAVYSCALNHIFASAESLIIDACDGDQSEMIGCAE